MGSNTVRGKIISRSELIDVDGIRLAYARTGPSDSKAPSLVLAHGLTDDGATWNNFAHGLYERFDVVQFDARGHGASSRAGSYLAEDHVADLVGLITELDLRQPVIIGHSMGAVHAAMAAAHVRLRAVVLEDPHWPEEAEDGTKDIGASRRPAVATSSLTSAERRAQGRAMHPSWPDLDIDTWERAQPHVDPDVVGWFRSWPTTNRWRDHVRQLDCPALLLTGDPGTVTPAAAAQAHMLSPQLQTTKISGAGHNIRRDQFDKCWRAVSDFLGQLDFTSPT